MLFSSITFLLYFLPVVFLVYAIAPTKIKNPILVIASLVFYAWGEPKYVFLMLATITAGYGFGLLIEYCRERQKEKGAAAVFVVSVVCVLGALGVFKYTDFLIGTVNSVAKTSLTLQGIALPVGISFYSFQLISYLADVYKGREKAQKNYWDLAAYISFFPQLIAGPIVRYGDIVAQLKKRTHTAEQIYYGVGRFIVGLSKKMLLANILAEFCAVFYKSDSRSVIFCWAYGIAFALQVYFDFSGYSDMAIGLGAIFGFSFPENFNYPFVSGSITEFWRRWHMTLGTWFRDYAYIPLGGNRVKFWKHLRNILIVWALTGLWHGASWNFVVWGLYYAFWLLMEKYVLKSLPDKIKPVRYVCTIILTIIGFIIFDSTVIKDGITVIGNMFGIGDCSPVSAESVYYLRSYAFVIFAGCIGATPLPKLIYLKIKNSKAGGKILSFAEPVMLVIILLFCVSYMVDGSFNPFLYFRF